jgi:hypothetical protein
VLRIPSFEVEGAKGIIGGLAKLEVHPILSRAICSILLHVGSFDVVQRVGRRSLMCVHHA